MGTNQLSWSTQSSGDTYPLQRWLSRGFLSVFSILILLAVMAVGYYATLAPVTIVVDGQVRSVRTNQRAVDNILREAGIPIEADDIVGPTRGSSLADDQSTIIVQHARPVTVQTAGHAQKFQSQTSLLPEILKQADVQVREFDRVTVNGQILDRNQHTSYAIPRDPRDRSPISIDIQRAVPVALMLSKAGEQKIQTPAQTVGEALNEAGVQLYLADRITPTLATPLVAGTIITVEQSVPINIDVDGRTIRTRTLRSQVGEVLNDLGVALVGEDYTQPAIDAPVQADSTVRVVRVREEVLVEQEAIPYETVKIPDAEMEIDNSTVTEGESGIQQKRTVIRYENGQEVARNTDLDFVVLKSPVNKEYRYGTKIVIRTLDTPDGPIEYWRKVRTYATSYSAATSGTPKTAKWYGITATGLPMRKGMVAVDPSVISLGTKLYVPGYGMGLAADTGGGVRGRWVDLGYDDDNLQGWWWWVDTYLLTPVPGSINYELPNWPQYKDRGNR
jgi:resuscitation-promoting factor RpfB